MVAFSLVSQSAEPYKALFAAPSTTQANQSSNAATTRELRGHRSKVHAVAWSPGAGSLLATGSTDHSIRLFSTEHLARQADLVDSRGTTSLEMKETHGESVDALAWCPSSNHHSGEDYNYILASASADKTVRLWDTRTRECQARIPTTGENINICWSPDGQLVLSGSKDDCVSVVDVRMAKVRAKAQFEVETNELFWAKAPTDASPGHPFDCDDVYMATGNGSVAIYQFCTSREDAPFRLEGELAGHTAGCYCLDLAGPWMAVGGADSLVSIWHRCSLDNSAVSREEHNAKDMWHCVRTMGTLEFPVRAVSLSHDAALVAAGSEDKHIAIWHTQTGVPCHLLPIRAELNTLEWHPTRMLLAWSADEVDARTGRSEGNVRVWIGGNDGSIIPSAIHSFAKH